MKHHHQHSDMETDPAQLLASTSTTAAGLAPRHGETDKGWKKLERERKEKGEKRGQGFGREVGVPSQGGKARGRGGVSVTAFIGRNRCTRPQKARNVLEESELSSETERQRRGGRGSGRVSP